MSYRDSQRSTLVAGGKEFDYFSIADLPDRTFAVFAENTCGESYSQY